MHNYRWARIILRMLYETAFTSLLLYFFAVLYYKEIPGFFVVFSFLLLYVLSFGIREWAPTHILVLFLHLIPMVGICLLPFSLGIRIILMGIQIYLMISAVMYSYKGAVIKPITDVPWPSFLVCFFIYILSLTAHASVLTTAAYIVTILLLVIYYLLLYVEGLSKYIDAASDVSGLPLKRMLHTNTTIVGMIILILLFGLFMGHLLGTDGLANVLLAVSRTIVQYLFLFIGFLLSKWQEIMGTSDLELDYADGELVAPEVISGWGVVLEVLLLIAFAGGMIFLFYHLLRKLIKLLLKPRSYEEDIIEAAEKERTVTKEKSKGRIRVPRSLTLAEKARRYYKLRIMKHKDELSLDGQRTCRDIQKEMLQQGLEDVNELTELYSEIRYGTRAVDKKTLRKMKELAD